MRRQIETLFKISFIAVLSILALSVNYSLGQETYPNRPINVIVFWGPGQTDTLTRVICKAAEKYLGQPLIVENKPGGSAAIGMNYVAKSEPDGYTIGVSATSVNYCLPHMRKVPYNILTDCTDICAITKYKAGLCVKADAPWNTFEDLLAFAKKNPGKFKYGSAGKSGTQYIAMERIAMKEGIRWTQIPFKSGGEAALACLGGHTDAVAQGPIDVSPHLRAGKLKLILALNDSRWKETPNVPNCKEKYGFSSVAYTSFVGPKNMPIAIVQKLEAAFKKAMGDPSFVDICEKFDVEQDFMTGKQYSDFWRSEYDNMGKVIKALGITED